MKTEFKKDPQTGNLETYIQYGPKRYRVLVQPDIAARGGHKGPGTTVNVWTDLGLRGYHGPWNINSVRHLIRKALGGV